jgi:ferredoxin
VYDLVARQPHTLAGHGGVKAWSDAGAIIQEGTVCEFCTKHGEGKVWYLQMANYSRELLHEDLSAVERDATGVTTRLEWAHNFWETFVYPAFTGVAVPHARPQSPGMTPTEDQILAHRKVDHFGQVLTIEDVEKVIGMMDSITRIPCGCRFLSTGKTDQRYCFGLGIDRWGILGKYPDAASSLEVLTKEEASRMFRAFDDEGLVHSIWTGVTPYVIGMCNCDRDCGAYGGYIVKRGAPSFFRGESICQVDWDLCTGCKSCMSQCQFGAQFYSSALGKLYIEPARCFGCGVCRAACPNDAIALIPRSESPEAAGIWLKDSAH